ncbi:MULTISPECIES: membrane protein [Bacillus]|uniref:DUF4870 domain-containing protein n=1 Tax=Bacillus glycinifermentans TaxID=1664069 RepID=A0AAJ3Z195_9BACI|nr:MULTISPECIES: membrane protein [Bacillus]KKB75099.1 membrane protein [Bacillus sp. TH008]MBU8787545.1 hypothetical protein [Bacillus glycinifermentans]MDU0070400.1 hypothetical protein [Bacillus sp. IG6]MED8018158.1 hypothetical protein [Bacillus glycinifermentans]QAT67204.1 hypothetical protein EQZ20_21525 [Bacillus glycinifermentans]
MTRNNALIAAICYFSVFFAPLILPIAAYFITDDQETKKHAMRSLISHIIPFISVVILAAGAISGTVIFNDGGFLAFFSVFGGIIFFVVISLIIAIWNVVQGIKMLTRV